MSSRNWRVQAHYSVLYAAQFVLLGVQLPFLSGWLAREGFSAPEIGWLSGLSLGARLLFGPAVAFWADRGDNHAKALRLVSALFGAGALGLAMFGGKPLIALSAVAVLWSFGLLVPLSDTAILRADRAGTLHYGEVRAAGSAAFLLTNISAGFVIARTSIDIAVIIMAIAGATTFAIAMTLPLSPAPAKGASGDNRWRDAATLMTTPAFLLFLLTVGLIQGSHAAYYSFSILHWTALDYAATTVGFLWAVGVVAEIFVLTQVRGLVRRLGPETLIVIGGLGAAARWTLTGIEPPLLLLFAVQTLHAVSFAAAYLGAVEYVDRAIPKHLTNTAMTLMSTTGVGAITGLATVACGYLYEAGGAPAIYALTAAMGGCGAVGGLLMLRRRDKIPAGPTLDVRRSERSPAAEKPSRTKSSG